MNDYYPVAEIAKMYEVTTKTVYGWIKKGLKTKREHVSGLKYRQLIRQAHVEKFLKGGSK